MSSSSSSSSRRHRRAAAQEIEDEDDDTPPPQAIRARYLQKLGNPSEVARLLRGGVNLRKLAGGLIRAARPAPAASDLAGRMRKGLATFDGPVSILLASADRTAQVFDGIWDKDDVRVARCEGASHAFVEPRAREWLDAKIVDMLRG